MTQKRISLKLTENHLTILKRLLQMLITIRLSKRKKSTPIQTRSYSLTQMITSLKLTKSCLPTLRLRPLNHSAN